MTEEYRPEDDIAAYIDGELDNATREAFEAAMAADDDLRADVEALRGVDSLYADHAFQTAPPGFADHVMSQIAQERSAKQPVNVTAFPRWRMVAAAAMVVLIGGTMFLIMQPRVREAATRQNLASAPEPAMEEAFGDAEMKEEAATAGSEYRQGAVDRDDAAVDTVESESIVREQAPEQSLGRRSAEASELADAPQADPSSPPPPPAPMAAAPEPEGAAPEQQAARGATAMANAEPPAAAEAEAEPPADERAEMAKRSDQDAPAIRTIGDRRFEQQEDGWYQVGYAGEPTTAIAQAEEPVQRVGDVNRQTYSAPRAAKPAEADQAASADRAQAAPAPEPAMVTTAELEQLFGDAGIARAIALLEGDVVFKVGEVWYRLERETSGP